MPPTSLFYACRWERGTKPSAEDMADFNHLLRELSALDGAERKSPPEKTVDDFCDFMGMLQHVLIVARDARTHRIVGMAALHIKPLFAWGIFGEVEEFVVDARCRGVGVADMIDDALIEAARKFGVREITLTSNPLRVAANKFYLRRGYERYDTNHYRRHIAA